MRIRTIALSVVAAIILLAFPATSHHSNSAYESDQIMTVTGVVTEWRWSNPHTWLYLSVEDENGDRQEWRAEGRAPGMLRRAGWSREILEPGETVTVHMNPAKNGRPVGIIVRVEKTDGTILGNRPNFFQ